MTLTPAPHVYLEMALRCLRAGHLRVALRLVLLGAEALRRLLSWGQEKELSDEELTTFGRAFCETPWLDLEQTAPDFAGRERSILPPRETIQDDTLVDDEPR